MCEINSWTAVGLAAFACLEFWLGTTKLVAAGSTLELALNFIKKLVRGLE